ncbi:MAG: hypothetical protein HYX60_05570 [Legionella longbeachae]|nr:hypothetical protein [Legionella longbeachae]
MTSLCYYFPSDFVDQVLSLIANESEAGRKKIVAIARRAEMKYQRPVKSWLMGWIYKYTRVRGNDVEQSINVMEDFPDAYTRLQEFKLMISKGEWNVGSYNYYLFLELIGEISDYEPLDKQFLHIFVVELKNLVMKQINIFMLQYKSTLEEKKNRELEREKMNQKTNDSFDNVMLFNTIEAAKKALLSQHDRIVFCVHLKNNQWHLNWVEATGKIYSLSPGDELRQKLTTLVDQDLEKVSSINLKRIKRECIKAKDQYLAKIQLIINPETEDFKIKGIKSTFVLRDKERESSLWWINSLGTANQISLNDYPQLNSWLTTHKNPSNELDVSILKTYLLGVKTAQSFSVSKMESMNVMISKVLNKKPETPKEDKNEVGKLHIEKFKNIEQHLIRRVQENIPKSVVQQTPQKLTSERYEALSQLPNFWRQRKVTEKEQVVVQNKMSNMLR